MTTSEASQAKDTQLQMDIEKYSRILSEQGYVIIPDLISKELREQIQKELEPHRNKFGRNDFEGKLTQRVYALLSKAPSIAQLVEHPLTTGIIDNYLTETYYMMICQTADICPGEKPQGLHADDDGGAPPRPRGPNGISTMWALSDFTDENGATRFIPGSHTWTQEQVDGATNEMTVGAKMKAGSVLVYMGHVLHGGGMNTSDNIRNGISIIYTQPWLRQFENMVLSVPPEVACRYSKKVQRLLGYSTLAGTFIGQTDGRDPIRLCEEAEERLKSEGKW